jgi:YARHG domain
MKTNLLIPVIIAGSLFYSCSKPSADQSEGDSTSVATDQPQTNSGVKKPAALTSEQLSRVQAEIFFMLHNDIMSDGGPNSFPYKETYMVTANKIDFELLRHNGEQWANWSPDDNVGLTERWINEIDTIKAQASYVVLEEEILESKLRRVRVVFEGTAWQTNAYEKAPYGEQRPVDNGYPLTDLIVDLGEPLIVGRDELYIKAKIMDLNESDLTGMSKDELALLRNEIFARHGHTFKTEKMMNYFGPKDWYYEATDDASILFTSFEKRNVEFIKKREG